MATECPCTTPRIPAPTNSSTSTTVLADAPNITSTDLLTGCVLCMATAAIEERMSWSMSGPTHSSACVAEVSVPVLSKTTVSDFATSSSTPMFFTNMPRRPSTPIAVPNVAGAASVSAHGQAMMSTALSAVSAIPRSGNQKRPPTTATPTAPIVNHAPNVSARSSSDVRRSLAPALFQSDARYPCDTGFVTVIRRRPPTTFPPA